MGRHADCFGPLSSSAGVQVCLAVDRKAQGAGFGFATSDDAVEGVCWILGGEGSWC